MDERPSTARVGAVRGATCASTWHGRVRVIVCGESLIGAAAGGVGAIRPVHVKHAERAAHAAAALPDGRVLVVGGFGRGENTYTATAELYDPSTGRFTPTGSLTTPRMDHVAVLLDDGRVLLAGGSAPAGRSSPAPSCTIPGPERSPPPAR